MRAGRRARAAPRSGRRRPDGDGWDDVEVSFHDLGWYSDYLASFGPDVIAIDPPDLRDAVIRRLKGVPQ